MTIARAAALCLVASTLGAQQWVALDAPALDGGNAAYDDARGRAVVLGADGELWEIDGSSRALHRPADGTAPRPLPRVFPTMAYDPIRRHVLVFGGLAAQAALGDTWTWDGTVWRQPFSTITPPRRVAAAMAFDLQRGRMVLHGGTDSTPLTDTWEHDGTQWLQRLPATSPPGFQEVGMAYDVARGVSVLVGMGNVVGVQVHEWDGVDWRLRTPAGPAPSSRFDVALVHDPLRRRSVMLGGSSEVWEWDGTSWTLAGSVPAFSRFAPTAWFDTVLGEIVVAGGRDQLGNPLSDWWSWNGSRALRRSGPGRPAARIEFHWLRDPQGDRNALFGGFLGGATSRDTWLWNGTAWSTGPVGPPSRHGAATAVDHANGRALLFGGASASTPVFNDLWSFSAGGWTQLPAATAPPGLMWAGLSFDEARSVAVLSGGIDSFGVASNSTWEWNGSTWTRRLVAGPSARYSHAQAYDPGNGRTLVFGGTAGNLLELGDTWSWDGQQWSQLAPPTSPPPNYTPSMAFDRARQRMMLLETQLLVSPIRTLGTTELWEFDGVTWTLLDQRPDVGQQRIVYDEQRQRVVSCDGAAVREWTPVPAAVAGIGAGCGAPEPRLAARTRPRIGEPEFGFEVLAAPGAAAVFALSDVQASTPLPGLPGCTLHIGTALASTLQLADGRGLALQAVPLPLAGALRGLALFAQAGALDPVTGAVAVTRGLRVAVGD